MGQQNSLLPSSPEVAGSIFRQTILCTACLQLLSSASVYDQNSARLDCEDERQQRSWQNLKNSSKDGCGFCDSLLNIIDQYNISPWGEKFDLCTVKIFGQVAIYDGAPGRYNSVDIKIDLHHQDQTGFVGTHSLSRESLAFVSRKFNECRKNHGLCGKIKEHPLPKRVLFVGSKSEDTIKLIERSQKRASYITLSHCWGDTKSIITTSQNISDHKISIPWINLPKLYRDAITFCRELEIQYIWIDSLCIKQDDVDDWAEESSKMASIYENSYLTLAATGARSHDGACASQLAPIHNFVEVGTIRLKGSSKSFPVLSRRPLFHPSHSGTYRNGPFDIVSEAWPLLSRAWVYQERLLPPRVLHFLPDELMWECKNGIECECQGITPNSSESMSFINVKNFRLLDRENTGLLRCSGCEKLQIWHSILERYTELELTIPTDRLPAISGIAQKLQGDQGDRYLAGLWESCLPDALFWSRNKFRTALSDIWPRPRPQAAPTWSWASVSRIQLNWLSGQLCRTCRNDRNRVCPIRIENVDVQPATVNPYGVVKANAALVVSGTTTSGFLRLSQRRPTFVISGIINEISFLPDYNFEQPEQYCIPQGSEVVCLYRHQYHDDFDGLIFRDIGEGKYERIGYVPTREVNSKESALFSISTLTLI
ncbi:heterokaryon incompatibility protein-domain-containing protein [Xylaria arbuscula]|nr:heterokaryon incompatibility protein-domain-containing protein [Xylaria arbuscula]